MTWLSRRDDSNSKGDAVRSGLESESHSIKTRESSSGTRERERERERGRGFPLKIGLAQREKIVQESLSCRRRRESSSGRGICTVWVFS